MSSTARYLRARKVVDRQINKWGMRAILRSEDNSERECMVLELEFTASERQAMKNPSHRTFSISAVNDALLAVPPKRAESLITFVQPGGTVELPPLRQVAPVKPLAAGGIVVYWDIQVE